ncbi:putative ABC transporter, auxiliary component YrbC [Caballeronia sordidicola]|jgi:phospholipid transport system substrate-binding protein|uniref:Putative ABC transporter, auxiliary component YrbC n=1 Tax=Caballeronia sordidicola TaxID=196367 RepID=A0A242N815_CABSO|nr:putative ABC transporter, auxiliary component YrbC [Caballeronia sordidicola]
MLRFGAGLATDAFGRFPFPSNFSADAMIKKLFGLSLFALLVTLSGAARAQSDDMSTPDGMMKTVTQQVLGEIKTDKAIQAGNLDGITRLVNEKILPYTDFTRTTRFVMGRNWASATPEQQKQIVEQFKLLLIRTYAGALSQVHDQQVVYQPFRAAPTDTDVVVRSAIMNSGSPLELDYRLYKTPQGWRVYDINVLGAWLIQVYQQQFSDQITQHGIDGLLTFLTQRNQHTGT